MEEPPLVPGLLEARWATTPTPPELDFVMRQVADTSAWIGSAVGTSPIVEVPTLTSRYGRQVRVMFETLSPVRSFKARGALTVVSSLSREEQRAGVITASTGNHAQGIAWAAQRCRIQAKIILPIDTSAAKLDALRALGADIELHGEDLADAAHLARERAAKTGQIFVEDGEDPMLMLGAATVMWDFLQKCPDLEVVLLPIGGGNLVAASLLAAVSQESSVSIIGVQTDAATGATASWLRGRVVERRCETVAGGLATTVPGQLSLNVMRAALRKIAVVSEHDLWTAIGELWTATGQIGEHAAVAGLAALNRFAEEIDGDKVGLVVTGSHLGADQLRYALQLTRGPKLPARPPC